MHDYLRNNNLIYKFQSGFRPSFSTDTALTYLTDKIRFNIDKGLYTGVVLIDLQKAFDTVNHEILFTKLKAVGVSDDALGWFISYMSDTNQFVEVNGCHSSFQSINCGVPQGSILGPLLFNIYVNDMVNAIKSDCELYLYADDSTIVAHGNNLESLETKLSKELENIKDWLDSNKLSLHLGKTESIVFGSKRKLKKRNKMVIECQGKPVEANTCVKYLGASIDQDLSGITMGNSVIKKVNSGLRFIYRKKDFLDFKARKLVCNSLFQSRIDYGHNVYYRSLNSNLKHKVQTAQNKMIRLILNKDQMYHLSSVDYEKVNFLPIEYRLQYLNLCMMFNINKGTAPEYMYENVKRKNSRYNTRNSFMSFELPQVKSQGKLSFVFSGIRSWNSLPDSLNL